MQEEWRPVVGFEGLYEVSNLGRIARIKAGKSNRAVWRLVKPHLRKNDHYLALALCKDGVYAHRKVHLFVAEAFLGPCPPGHEVNHKNGKRDDPRAENLEYSTRGENIRHARDVLGTFIPTRARGEGSGVAVLTDALVRCIRAMYKPGGEMGVRRIARQLGLRPTTVQAVVNRRTWAHVLP